MKKRESNKQDKISTHDKMLFMALVLGMMILIAICKVNFYQRKELFMSKFSNFIRDIIYIVENSELEINEKNRLLQFIEMVKKNAENVEKSKKLYIKAKSCFYKAYTECIKNACTCYGIEDIIGRYLELKNREVNF